MKNASVAAPISQRPMAVILRLVLACAICAAPTIGIAIAAANLAGFSPATAVVTQAIASIFVAAFTYRFFVHHFESRPISELSCAGAWREVGIGVAIGSGLFSLSVAVLAVAGAFTYLGIGKPSSLPYSFLAAVAAAFTEEVIFRGILFRLLESAFGSYAALVASSVVFGAFHLLSPGATAQGVVAIMLEAGLLLGVAFMVTRRLWLPIGLHFGWNFVQGGIFGTAVSGNPSSGLLQGNLVGPEWLSGGAFGAEASIVSIALCFVMAWLLFRVALAKHRVVPFGHVNRHQLTPTTQRSNNDG